MPIPNVSIVNIPPVSRESVQELSAKYEGSAITRSLVQSIDCDIEHRQRLLDSGYCYDEEVQEIINEIDYLHKLALSAMRDRRSRYQPIYE